MRDAMLMTMLLMSLVLAGAAWAQPQRSLQSEREALHAESSGALLLSSSLEAADSLAKALEDAPRYVVLAAPLADLEDPGSTAPLGRLISQQVGSRLAQHGFQIVEPTMRLAKVYREQQDALVASQENTALPGGSQARAALTGSYLSGRETFVSLRLVRLEDNVVLASYEYVLPRSAAVRSLLVTEDLDSVWGRYVGRKRALTSVSPDDVGAPQTPVVSSSDFPLLGATMGDVH